MNYFVDSALSLIGPQILRTGIENFTLIESFFTPNHPKKYSNFKYTEYKRGHSNFHIYPPSFQKSPEARLIFNSLVRIGGHEKYFKLFDIYSIILSLCFYEDYKTRESRMIKLRINDLEKILPKDFNLEIVKRKLRPIVVLYNNNISKFIAMAYYLIEIEMNKIKDTKISELNIKFYRNIFKVLAPRYQGF
jgi:hypothetical protein